MFTKINIIIWILLVFFEKQILSIQIFLQPYENNSNQTFCFFPECDGNFTNPFSNFQEMNFYFHHYYIKRNLSENCEIVIISPNNNTTKKNEYLTNPSNFKNYSYPDLPQFFSENNFSKIKIHPFCDRNENLSDCARVSIIINNPMFTFIVREELTLENIDLIISAENFKTIFILNNFASTDKVALKIKNCQIKISEENLDYFIVGEQLISTMDLNFGEVEIILQSSIIEKIPLSYGFLKINEKFNSCKILVEDSILDINLNTNKFAFFFLNGSNLQGVFTITRSFIKLNQNSLLFVKSNYSISLTNISIIYENASDISPKNSYLITFMRNNSFSILNSSINFINVDFLPLFKIFNNNSLSLQKSKVKFLNQRINKTNTMISEGLKQKITKNALFLLVGNKNKLVLNDFKIKFNLSVFQNNQILNSFSILGSFNIILMRNVKYFLMFDNLFYEENIKLFLIESKNISNSLIIHHLEILLPTQIKNYFFIDAWNNTLLQTIEVFLNNIKYYYNSSFLCKSSYFVDKNFNCNPCNNVISQCKSCVLGKSFEPICLISEDSETNTMVIIIISVFIPVGIILALIFCCVLQNYYKKQDLEQDLEPDTPTTDFKHYCSLDNIPYYQSFAVNHNIFQSFEGHISQIGFISEKNLSIELKIESDAKEDSVEESFEKK